MSQPRNFDPSKPPVRPRRCPKCGLPMLRALIEPTDQVGHYEQTFECLACSYVETVVLKLRYH